MTRACAACGRLMDVQNARKRYCSSTCRSAVSKGRVRPLADGPVLPIGNTPTTAGLVVAIAVELAQAGRVESALGRSAMHLASLIEGEQVPPAAIAGLNRELRATLAEALRTTTTSTVASIRDELAERRARGGA